LESVADARDAAGFQRNSLHSRIERLPNYLSLLWMRMTFKGGTSGLAVDLVGKDAQSEHLVDSLVEASEQLKQISEFPRLQTAFVLLRKFRVGRCQSG